MRQETESDSLDLTPYMYKLVSYRTTPHQVRVRISTAEGYAHELAYRLQMRNIRCQAKSRGTVEVNRSQSVILFLRNMELPGALSEAVEEYALLMGSTKLAPAEREHLADVVRRMLAYSPRLDYKPGRTHATQRYRR